MIHFTIPIACHQQLGTGNSAYHVVDKGLLAVLGMGLRPKLRRANPKNNLIISNSYDSDPIPANDPQQFRFIAETMWVGRVVRLNQKGRQYENHPPFSPPPNNPPSLELKIPEIDREIGNQPKT